MRFAANCLSLANGANRLVDKLNFLKAILADITAKLTTTNTFSGENEIQNNIHILRASASGSRSFKIVLDKLEQYLDMQYHTSVRIFNKRARLKYHILEKVEAGIVLSGAEIKSIRAGRVDLSESFAKIKNGEVFLENAHINPWMGSQKFSDSRRERKLLLHQKQILNWQGKIAGGQLTIAPLSIYIKGNLAKVDLALVKSKAKYDHRADLKKKAVERDIERELRTKG